MSISTDVSRALRWSVLGTLVTQAANWAITLLVVRLLAPEDYGLVALATAFVGLLVLFNELGLGPALIQAKTLEARQIRAVSGLVIMANAVLAVGLLAMAPAVTWFFGDERLRPILYVLSLHFPLAALGMVPQAMMIRGLAFKSKSLVDTVAQISGGALALCLAYLGFGVWTLVWSSLGTAAVKCGGLWLVAPQRHWPSLDPRAAKGMLDFGAVVAAQRLAWWLYSQADIFVVGKMYTASVLGPYAVAAHLASLPQQKISATIIQLAFSGFSRIQADRNLLAAYLAKAIRFLGMVAFPLCLGMSSVAPEMVAVVLGDEWAAVVLPLQLLSLVVPLRMFATPINEALNALRKPAIVLINTLITGAIVITGLLVGSPHGISGVCLSWLIGFPMALAINVKRASLHTGFTLRHLVAVAWRPFVAALTMYCVVTALRGVLPPHLGPSLRLVALVAAGAVVYPALMLVIDRRNCRELLAFLR